LSDGRQTSSFGKFGEFSMSFPVLVRVLALFGTFSLFLLAVSPPALAECSDGRVKRMLKQGKTVASIAHACEMNKEDVLFILEEDEEDGLSNGGESTIRHGLPRGAPVGQCGCWGYVSPEMRQPHPECQSGYAEPSMCNAMCQMGGFAWRGVCS
jgi:hypothetical protein